MKNKLIIVGMFLAFLFFPFNARAQIVGIHTNLLGWCGLTPNIGLEVGFAKNWSVQLDGAYNPFTFSEGRSTKYWAIQPEVKFWPRYKFSGHYIGIHGHFAQYDWGLWQDRYRGKLGGCGLSYGYAWIIADRWGIEANIGAGWSLIQNDDVSDRKNPGICYGPLNHGHWGLTKLGIKISYLIK